jgi:Ni/Fe-hydrogenase subunit HybB-like protein
MGEIYAYAPTLTEVWVSAGIFGVGALIFTLTSRVAIAVLRGELRHVPESD